jgi:urocanate hydratase
MRRILSALMTAVMLIGGGVIGKTALKRVAPGMITQSAKQAAKQGAKATGKAAKSTNVQKGAAATATSGAAASVATQLHEKGDGPDIVDEAQAHEPTEQGPAASGDDREKRYRRRDLADTSDL